MTHILLGLDKFYQFYPYPFLAVLTGFAFFVMGARHWGRCYVFGVAFFVLAALMPLMLPWSALAFGLLWCGCLVSIGRHLRGLAVETAEQSKRPSWLTLPKVSNRLEGGWEQNAQTTQTTVKRPQSGS